MDIGPFICIDFLSGSSLNAKVRRCNIIGTLNSGNAIIIGANSSGVSDLSPSVSNAIRSSVININSVGSLPARSIYINGSNRFVVRETIMFSQGSGTDLVSCETNFPDCVLSIKSCTISGNTCDLLDTQGTILLGASDLINHLAPKGFTVDIQPNSIFYGIIGYLGGNLTYYLPPGVTPIASVSNIAPFTYSFISTTIIFSLTITYSGALTNTDTITFTIYKNGIPTALSVVLTSSSSSTIFLDHVGVTFLPTDTIDARLITVGNPNTGTFTGTIQLY